MEAFDGNVVRATAGRNAFVNIGIRSIESLIF